MIVWLLKDFSFSDTNDAVTVGVFSTRAAAVARAVQRLPPHLRTVKVDKAGDDGDVSVRPAIDSDEARPYYYEAWPFTLDE